MSINACTFVGNLTRDPELKALPTGTQVCEFSIAVNERIKQQGEWTDYANYFDIVVYGGQAENCAKFLAKGRQVAVTGRAKHERWKNQQGETRSRIRFVAQEVQFIGGRDDAAQPQWGGQPVTTQPVQPSGDFGGPPGGEYPNSAGLSDPDIPF